MKLTPRLRTPRRGRAERHEADSPDVRLIGLARSGASRAVEPRCSVRGAGGLVVIVTFNVGLLCRFGRLLMPTPHVDERFAMLASALRESGADIVALQELYERRHWRQLRNELRTVYPYGERAGVRSWPFLSSGLCVLSRVPVRSHFVRFRDGPLDELLLANKGAIVVTALETRPPLTLINTHTTAGGAFSLPEQARAERFRDAQIRQLIGVAGRAKDGTVLLLGDMNAGPAVSDHNYNAFASASWTDVHAFLNPRTTDITWDPANPLNVSGPHRTCPRQRIDHVFVRSRQLTSGSLQLLASKIVFADPCVALPTAAPTTLSDHYGLRVELESGGASSAS